MPEEHRTYWRGRLLERRRLLYLIGGGVLTFGIVHYGTHINEAPVTHRQRYLAFTKEQFIKLAEFQYNMVMTSLLSSEANDMFVYCVVINRCLCALQVKAATSYSMDIGFIPAETRVRHCWCQN